MTGLDSVRGDTERRKLDSARGFDVGFSRIGGLRVAMNDADIAELRLASQEKRDRWGLDIEWLDRQALRAEAPWLALAM